VNNLATMCLPDGRLTEAIGFVQKSLGLVRSDFATNTMAMVQRMKGDFDQAINFALEASRLNSTDATNWLELGDCYFLSRRHNHEADAAYRRCVEVQKDELQITKVDGRGWMVLALAQAKVGSFEDAKSLMDQAERNVAGDIATQLSKTRILELLGDRDGALQNIVACRKRGATVFQFESMPDMEQLHRDPRYKGAISLENSTSVAKG
jgi:tetratricopeptide (TPR) repeat protein